jgi:hypothetical protein
MEYKVKVNLTEPMLASSPCDPEVYRTFIMSKNRDKAKEMGDEVETLSGDQLEAAGWSVFHGDENGLFLFDYKIRGFLKEAAISVTPKKVKGETNEAGAIMAVKSKIDRFVFVAPRRIYLSNGDGVIKKAHGTLERPLRAMTMQGPRITLKRSDYVDAGTHFEARIIVLPLGQVEIKESHLRAWLDYGRFQGFGEWRNGSYGRFDFELTRIS